MRMAIVATVALGCGRFHFDPLSSASEVDAGHGNFAPTTDVYLKPSNTTSFIQFGYAAALARDGATYAVGSPNQANGAGSVYVFARSGMTWSQQAYLQGSNAASPDQGGYSVALSADGNTLAFAAVDEASAAMGIDGNQADNSTVGAGAVYVFTRTAGVWTQQAYVKASNTNANDQFGSALALSGDGNTLAVGALDEASAATGIDGNQADNSAMRSGAIYVFTRAGTTWTQQAYVKASNTGTDDSFGYTIALSADGNTLAAGAYAEASAAHGIDGDQADNTAPGAGAVYTFVRDGITWSQQAYVKASNAAGGAQFGLAVSLSNDGNVLAVGAGHAANTGAAYVFARAGTTWSEQESLEASNAGTNDGFGAAVALSGDGYTLAVGATDEDSAAAGIGGDQTNDAASNAGACYVFARTGVTWNQIAYVKSTNPDANDLFGHVVWLSSDGATLAIVAHHESSAAVGVDGDQSDNSAPTSGAAYIYE